MSEWQPIHTAPKDDGYTYLILRGTYPGAHTCIGTFYNGRWKVIHADIDPMPTHWMPLPKPPHE